MDGLVAGRIVHYVAPGSADGRYPPAHRAAMVTQVSPVEPEAQAGEHCLDLVVFNPTGLHWVMDVPFDAEGSRPYSWHWIERG